MSLVSVAIPLGLRCALCSVLLLATNARGQVLVEDFNDNSINPTLWRVDLFGSGPQIAEANQQLQTTIPDTSSGDPFSVNLVSKFRLRGDFDVQVDYRLLGWPFSNGVRVGLGINESYGVERTSFGSPLDGWGREPREVYVTDFLDGPQGVTGTGDVTGTLRLVRTGATLTGYYYSPGQWVAIHVGPGPTADVALNVSSWSHDYAFMDWDVTAAFDNLTVNSGELVWPIIVPVRGSTWGSVKALYR